VKGAGRLWEEQHSFSATMLHPCADAGAALAWRFAVFAPSEEACLLTLRAHWRATLTESGHAECEDEEMRDELWGELSGEEPPDPA